MAEDTIFALSSGVGRAGIAVIRVSGAGVRFALETMCDAVPLPRICSLKDISSIGGELLDRGLVVFFPGPNSYTGEDMCEFMVHGGRAVISATLGSLGELPGFRPAGPGEFSRRAFEAGKLDLVEAEGIAELIDSETEEQRKAALRQVGGELSDVYSGWRSTILGLRALVEAELDFSDESDVSGNFIDDIRRGSGELARSISSVLDAARRGSKMRDGFVVAVVGAPNSGKSSLVNWLAGRQVAIVHQIAGTTRDVIEVRLELRGLPVTVLDTAGLRTAESDVEAEGIRRGLARAESADLVIELIDSATNCSESAFPYVEMIGEKFGRDRHWQVRSRCDLGCGDEVSAGVRRISVRSGVGLEDLLREFGDFAVDALGTANDCLMAGERHRKQLERARECLLRAAGAEGIAGLELLGEDLRSASRDLEVLIGAVRDEDVLGDIFSTFCIGK